MDDKYKEFLINLAKEQYDHGDSFYAFKNKKGNWEFGSNNDEPLKFGNGNSNQMKSSLVKILYDKLNK